MDGCVCGGGGGGVRDILKSVQQNTKPVQFCTICIICTFLATVTAK